MDNKSEVNEVKEPSEKYNGNPQVEDGFTKISNELLEALSKAMAQGIITARERAVIDWIIRYTYGYQQKNGYFHTSFIAKNLGLSMSWISQILKSLEKKKVIIRNGEEIQINKHYLEWSKYLEPSKCLEHSKQNLEHSKHYLEPSKQSEPTNSILDNVEGLPKENIYKENNNKENKNPYIHTDSDVSNPSLTEKEKDLKDTPPVDMPPSKVAKPKKAKETGEVPGTEIFKLVKTFYEMVGLVWNQKDAMEKNSRAASKLLHKYTYDDIVKSIRIGIKEYKNEKKDPKYMMPTLESVNKRIHVWLSEEQENQPEPKKEAGYGYF